MGNCCADPNIIRTNLEKGDNAKEERFGTNRLYSSEFPKEEENNGLGYSDIQSEFSVNMVPEEELEHCPDPNFAVKVQEIPEDLRNMIDDRTADVSVFDYDEDNELVDKAYLLGPRQLSSHAIYIGQWFKQKRNGRGQQISADGSIYEGYWVNDKKQGKGRMIDSSGDIFRGYWKGDVCDGYGELTKTSGAIIKGQWKDNKRDGHGTEIWPTGERYEGNYKDGQKHGLGKYYTRDNSFYQGEFKFNSIDGHGVFKWSNGNTYKGQWVNNEKHGEGVYIWKGGDSFTGTYIEDHRHGKGIYTKANNIATISGNWEDDVLEGAVKVEFQDGKVVELESKRGELSCKGGKEILEKSKQIIESMQVEQI